jgi:hypothetical protein
MDGMSPERRNDVCSFSQIGRREINFLFTGRTDGVKRGKLRRFTSERDREEEIGRKGKVSPILQR